MSNLKNRYQEIFEELENYIQDEKEKEFVMSKFQELSIMFMDVIDRLTYITDLRIQDVEEKQKEMEEKICNVQNAVNGIESDIYEDTEEAFEFEIVCPYCNNEFSADIDCNMNTEVECPECHNVIELDWNEDEECEHDCSCCSHDCMEEEIENKKQNKQEDNNQDDM